MLVMKGLSYKERLDMLGLWSLGHRRLRCHLIEVYKILRGIDKMNDRCLFPRVGDFKTRQHIFEKRHRSNDSTASGRDRSHSCDSVETMPFKLKEEQWLGEISNAFMQQYIQYLQSMGFILVQVRPPSPTR
eukprot:g31235.t1